MRPILASAETPLCELASPAEQALGRVLASPSNFSFEGTLLLERAEGREFLAVKWPEPAGGGSLRRMNTVADPVVEPWPTPAASPRRICDLLRLYSPSLDKGRIIAGRETDRLTLRPRDSLRLPHRINIDKDTGMALAMATAGPDGQMLERYEYAEIRYGPRLAANNEPTATTRHDPERVVVPGFFLILEEPDGGVFVVSDGLATASVFVEPLPLGAPGGEGAVIQGATLTYTRGVPGSGGGLLISVLGEVPLVTARLLADAVRAPKGAE
ncbi:MAG: MucB/RseB C-terminal domain-containing protein [Halieaceae bacterium]